MQVYADDDHAHHPDRATLDHLNTRPGYGRTRKTGCPRPAQGWTILACADCNSFRGMISQKLRRELTVCQECARLGTTRFCCGECFEANMTRLGVHLLPWEQHKLERKIARIREKRRKHKRRWREKRRLARLGSLS